MLVSLVIVSTYCPDVVLVNTLFQWQLYAKFRLCCKKFREKTVDTFQIDWAIIWQGFRAICLVGKMWSGVYKRRKVALECPSREIPRQWELSGNMPMAQNFIYFFRDLDKHTQNQLHWSSIKSWRTTTQSVTS